MRQPTLPGQRSAETAVMLAAIAAGALVIAGVLYFRDADLRDTAGLAPATGTVVRQIGHVKGRPPELLVRWTGPDARVREVRIPHDSGQRVQRGTRVNLLYDPNDPARVRTTKDWWPAGNSFGLQAGMFALAAACIAVVGLVRQALGRRRAPAEPTGPDVPTRG